jgi:hypothetical protein
VKQKSPRGRSILQNISEEIIHMKLFPQKQLITFISLLGFFLLACNATFAVAFPTPTIPIPTQTSVATSAPLISQQVTLVSIPFNETNPGPGFPTYTLTAQTPQLTGSDDPRVVAFNQHLSELITKEVDTWRQSFQELRVTSNSTGSTLDVKYTLISQIGDIWSFKFDSSFYADSAAHPGLNSMTLNYDLGQGKELALSDLFLPNTNYLETISNYCVAELSKQQFFDGPFVDGAKPTADNYRNWNITPDGLLITFDTYQVGPGAAGPQQVNVPYSELTALINAQGPLAVFIR